MFFIFPGPKNFRNRCFALLPGPKKIVPSPKKFLSEIKISISEVEITDFRVQKEEKARVCGRSPLRYTNILLFSAISKSL